MTCDAHLVFSVQAFVPGSDTSNATTILPFKAILLGLSCVGKSAFLQYHVTGEFREDEYVRTWESKEESITFPSNYGPITFNVRDVPGYRGPCPSYQKY